MRNKIASIMLMILLCLVLVLSSMPAKAQLTPYSTNGSLGQNDSVWCTISGVQKGDLVIVSVYSPDYTLGSMLFDPYNNEVANNNGHSSTFQLTARYSGIYLLLISSIYSGNLYDNISYTVSSSHQINIQTLTPYIASGTLTPLNSALHTISGVKQGDSILVFVSSKSIYFNAILFSPDHTTQNLAVDGTGTFDSDAFHLDATTSGTYLLEIISSSSSSDISYSVTSSHQIDAPVASPTPTSTFTSTPQPTTTPSSGATPTATPDLSNPTSTPISSATPPPVSQTNNHSPTPATTATNNPLSQSPSPSNIQTPTSPVDILTIISIVSGLVICLGAVAGIFRYVGKTRREHLFKKLGDELDEICKSPKKETFFTEIKEFNDRVWALHKEGKITPAQCSSLERRIKEKQK